jgi:hypothetical protein
MLARTFDWLNVLSQIVILHDEIEASELVARAIHRPI